MLDYDKTIAKNNDKQKWNKLARRITCHMLIKTMGTFDKHNQKDIWACIDQNIDLIDLVQYTIHNQSYALPQRKWLVIGYRSLTSHKSHCYLYIFFIKESSTKFKKYENSNPKSWKTHNTSPLNLYSIPYIAYSQ